MRAAEGAEEDETSQVSVGEIPQPGWCQSRRAAAAVQQAGGVLFPGPAGARLLPVRRPAACSKPPQLVGRGGSAVAALRGAGAPVTR